MRLVLAATLALVAVPALAQGPIVYTGCLRSSDGSLYSVRVGTAPMTPCKAKDKQISWNMAGQPGPPGPPGAGMPGSATINVLCGSGDGAGDQISRALQTPASSLTIVISGSCEESIKISRDNVRLVGGATGAGLHSNSTEEQLVSIYGRNVSLDNLTLQGGGTALSAGFGSSFQATTLDVSGAFVGVQVSDAIGVFNGCRIHSNTSFGFALHAGSSVSFHSTDVYDNEVGVSLDGGEVQLWQDTTIRDNTRWGLFVSGGGNVHLNGATVTRNPQGLFLAWGAIGDIRYSQVTANTNEGIVLMHGAVLALQEQAVVEANGVGVSAQDNSSVIVNNGSTVRGNRGDGVYLTDTSDLFINLNGVIEGNQGWGVYCEPEPNVVGIHGRFQPSAVGPNASGRVNCPGVNAP